MCCSLAYAQTTSVTRLRHPDFDNPSASPDVSLPLASLSVLLHILTLSSPLCSFVSVSSLCIAFVTNSHESVALSTSPRPKPPHTGTHPPSLRRSPVRTVQSPQLPSLSPFQVDLHVLSVSNCGSLCETRAQRYVYISEVKCTKKVEKIGDASERKEGKEKTETTTEANEGRAKR